MKFYCNYDYIKNNKFSNEYINNELELTYPLI